MKRTGAGTYTIDTNTYVTTSSLTTEGSWTPEFEGAIQTDPTLMVLS